MRESNGLLINHVYLNSLACTETMHFQEPTLYSQSQMPAVQIHGDESNVNQNQVQESEASTSSTIQITEEQKARMEASRLKALERVAARARSFTAD